MASKKTISLPNHMQTCSYILTPQLNLCTTEKNNVSNKTTFSSFRAALYKNKHKGAILMLHVSRSLIHANM